MTKGKHANMIDVSTIVHNHLLKELELECNFFEHTLTMEQLSDLHPLSRINLEHPECSKGLNKDEAASRLVTDGRNVVFAVTGRTTTKLLLKQFSHTFRLMLLTAALTCFIIYALDTTRFIEIYLGIALIVIFFILCGVSYWQEQHAKKNMQCFQSMMTTYCYVVRAAERIRINVSDVVIGDIVYLCPGSRVPADLRLIYTDELKLDTSWITGELEPLDFCDTTVPKNVTALGAQNIALNGCLCTNGTGYGVAIRTGDRTIIGKIARVTSKQKGEPTRLELEHKRFVNFISTLAITMATITFVIGLLLTNFQHLINTFVNGFLVIIIANIPQGLPITLGAALAIVARRLAKQNIFMKRLDVVETLGTATVVMCDKTGIFTLNDITVSDLWYQLHYFKGIDELKAKRKHLSVTDLSVPLSECNNDTLVALLTVMSICNKAHLEPLNSRGIYAWHMVNKLSRASNTITIQSLLDGKVSRGKISDAEVERTVRSAFHHKVITGSENEVALLKYVEELANGERIRRNYEIIFEVPFNRQRRFQMVIVRQRSKNDSTNNGNTKLYFLVKGAPEELFAHCKLLATEDGCIKISDDFIAQFSEAYTKYGNEGKSCIAFAIAEFEELNLIEYSGSWDGLNRLNLCFLGMVAMYDPPRDTALESLQTMKNAGVKCFMVTGDHPSTAAAVAGHFGLAVPRASIVSLNTEMEKKSNLLSVIHCEMIDTLSEQLWDDILKQEFVVFARATPSHKLIIVKECRRRGEVVAVTGDGVLDAPALKEANVGIAMEAVESDVKHIVKSIKEGRLLYANLKKTIAYTLAHMVPELCAVMLAFAIGFPIGLSSLQVLSIDLITEIPPSIALTYEAGEKDIMCRPPRKLTARLVSKALLVYSYIFVGSIISVGCFIAYLFVFWFYEISLGDLFHSNIKHWRPNAEMLSTTTGKHYTAEMQMLIHGQAKAAWHITLVMSQVFHFWLCTTRRISVFKHGTQNIAAVLALLIEICILNFMIYMPGVQHWLSVTHPPAFVWLFCLPVGIILIIFNETRKWLIRRYPTSNIIRALKW
ncbi:haloacid dehalogenase-like hydrolase family protein [Brugia malayi]|uniref:Haloacid dehalogenase-like hydrolase family protein n=1 Tax=Brugia malayi TaxID=6279 RepID=A0A4E9FEV0_BRUMA|nr:haloacid dehalogenase-like hydrolase family protein [Brugia malayi]VIO94952.1 haloacid dehalogenase-like hydrolase family protein [Brugia malayi]